MALELGPCAVYFGATGAEVDLGKTNGGVTVRIADASVDLTSDQYGSSPEDTVITGTTAEIELSLADITMARLGTALGQTPFGTNTGVAGVNKVGTQLLAASKNLILKKYVDGSVSASAANWVTFPAASPVSNIELSYDAANQRVMKLTFKCFSKAVSANWGSATGASSKTVLYYFGNKTSTT